VTVGPVAGVGASVEVGAGVRLGIAVAVALSFGVPVGASDRVAVGNGVAGTVDGEGANRATAGEGDGTDRMGVLGGAVGRAQAAARRRITNNRSLVRDRL